MEEVEDSKTKTNPYDEIQIVIATHDHANSRCATLVNHLVGGVSTSLLVLNTIRSVKNNSTLDNLNGLEQQQLVLFVSFRPSIELSLSICINIPGPHL